MPVSMAITSPSPVVAGQQASELSISFANASSAQILPSSFVEGHDRILHIVAVGEDLDTFAHVHPEEFGLNTSAAGAHNEATVLSFHSAIRVQRSKLPNSRSAAIQNRQSHLVDAGSSNATAFKLRLAFPKAGRYMVAVDGLLPAGQVANKSSLVVQGSLAMAAFQANSSRWAHKSAWHACHTCLASRAGTSH